MKTLEHDEQSALFQWAALQENQIPALQHLFEIPNGGHRHKAVAVKLQQEGVKAGVPDIFLAFPYGGFHGLFIEMKAGSNTTTERQDEWIGKLLNVGYMTAVCYSFETAKQEILDYLGIVDADL